MKRSTDMSKRIVYLLLPFVIGCNFLFPQTGQNPAPLPTRSAPATAAPVKSTPLVGSTSAPATGSTAAFTITRINVQDGDLHTQLAREAQKAQTLNQIPFLEFDATWCPPCVAINESLDAKDAITLQAFAGAYIIRADVDEWGWGDGDKFKFDGIPVYYRLDYDGNPTGASVDGSAWGDNIPQNFAPVLDEFFHRP
jgi:thiol-disulfide isomerase/thioredoxin